MEKDFSRDIAFFSILSTALNLNLNDAVSNYTIILDDISKVTKFPKDKIVQSIESLQKNGVLEIRDQNDKEMVLDVSRSYTKLSKVFTQDEIEEILKELDYFINKYDELIILDIVMTKYVNMTKKKIKSNLNADLNDVIQVGISEIFNDKKVMELERKIYDICDEASSKDLKIIEVILFCFYNFSKMENPFFVTLFLASIYKNID